MRLKDQFLMESRLGEHEPCPRRPATDRIEAGVDLARVLEKLPARDVRFVVFRYVLGCTLAEIGAMWGITKQAAEQAERAVLERSRRVLRGEPAVRQGGRPRKAAAA